MPTHPGWEPQPLNFSNGPIGVRVFRLLAAGQLDVKPIVGGTWPLEQWREAFEAMHPGAIAKAAVLTPRAARPSGRLGSGLRWRGRAVEFREQVLQRERKTG